MTLLVLSALYQQLSLIQKIHFGKNAQFQNHAHAHTHTLVMDQILKLTTFGGIYHMLVTVVYYELFLHVVMHVEGNTGHS